MIHIRSGLPFLAAVAWVAAATAIALLLQRLPHANLSLVFLIAVLVVAVGQGFWPSVFASLVSFLVYNFFFTPPFLTLEVHAEGDIATLLFFLLIAALAGKLAARMREEMTRSQAAVQRTSRLLAFSRRTAAVASVEGALSTLAESVAQAMRCSALAWAPDEDGRLELRASAGTRTDAPSQEDVDLAWRKEAVLHRSQGWLFLAVGTGPRRVGLLGINRDTLQTEEQELLIGQCDQAAVAVERVHLARDLDEARVASETEQFRSALLTSVSHDLRTPLATIIGSVTSLQELWPNLTEENRKELLQTILGESNRLDRYIQNLLDMTRLGHGAPPLEREWVDLNDVVASAAHRLETELDRVRLVVEIDPDAALIHVHGALIEQAIVNLLDNAAKFSPDGGLVTLSASHGEAGTVIDIVDEGPGVPESEREKVFDMFYRSKDQSRTQDGSGLGLAICRGLIGAHGGEIHALPSKKGSGTCMRVTLPAAEMRNRPQLEHPEA